MAKRKIIKKHNQKQKQKQSVVVNVHTHTHKRASTGSRVPSRQVYQQQAPIIGYRDVIQQPLFNQQLPATINAVAKTQQELAPVRTIETQTEVPAIYKRDDNHQLLDRMQQQNMKTPAQKSHGAYAENYDGFPNPSNLFNSGSNPPVNEAMLQINTPVADVVEPDFDKIIGQSKATIIKNFNKQQLVRYGIERIGLVPNSSGQYPKIDLLIKMLKAGKQT